MSDLWYRTCRGVESGGHSLVTTESRFFWRVRIHLRCAERGCDLKITEPSHPRFIRTGARLEYASTWLQCWLPIRFIRRSGRTRRVVMYAVLLATAYVVGAGIAGSFLCG